MRITYVTHTRFPTEKAHGHQIAQVCAALGELGHTVTLVHPNVWTQIDERDPWGYYGVSRSFSVKKLSSLDALQIPIIRRFCAFPIAMWSYRRTLKEFLKNDTSDIYYCRSWEVLDPILRTNKKTILELHTLPRYRRRAFVRRCNRCSRVVCLTSPMHDTLQTWGVHIDRLLVEGDGVSVERFINPPKETKTENQLPDVVPVIGYVGGFIAQNNLEKGIAVLIEALAILKKRHVHYFGWIVGGLDRGDHYAHQAASLGLTIDRDISFGGLFVSKDVPSKIALCDVCIYPAPKGAENHPYFMRDTSPLKLFEYLAADKPIVCADLPPLRDIVDETIVTFCIPGDPVSMADAIEWVLAHLQEAAKKATKGKEHVKMFDWKKRMRRILQGINS